MTTATRNPKTRTARVTPEVNGSRLLSLFIVKSANKTESFHYHLSAIDADYGRGYRLEKVEGERTEGEPSEYAALIDGITSSCECKGHLRHGTACKHISALQALQNAGKI
jgi:hypothetical protein